jgi:hypothetical protein
MASRSLGLHLTLADILKTSSYVRNWVSGVQLNYISGAPCERFKEAEKLWIDFWKGVEETYGPY